MRCKFDKKVICFEEHRDKQCIGCSILLDAQQTVLKINRKGVMEVEKPTWLKEKIKQVSKSAFLEFYKLKQGDNVIEFVLNVEPKVNAYTTEDRDVTRQVYRIKVEGKTFDLPVSTMLEKLILQALAQDINPMTINRQGESLETRYSIVELEKA